jgi:hypothetical protein
VLAFTTPFVIVCVLSCVTYWLARRPGVVMRWVKVAFSSTVLLTTLLCLTAAMGSIEPLSVFVCVLVALGASTLQAVLERAIDGASLTIKQQLVRSFFTYLSTFFIGYGSAVVVFSLLAFSTLTKNVWALNFVVAGFLAGLVIAPLSISFFRRMFQTLPLRPGMDRMLTEEELAA